jgi:integrase
MSKRSRGEGSTYLRGTTWWIAFSARGKLVRESSRSTRERDAVRLLRTRLGELSTGTFVGPKAEEVRFEDLSALLAQHYELRGLRSAKRMEQAVTRLAEHFAGVKALTITTAHILDYMEYRRQSGAAAATAAYEAAMLRKSFNLALERNLLPRGPKFPSLAVANNARPGFFEAHELEALCRELPNYLVPVARFAYYTGWRRGEINGLTWSRVDFDAGVIRLDVGTTKNDDARVFPMGSLPALLSLLKAQRSYCETMEIVLGRPIPWVFHKAGEPLQATYKSWRSACERAGLTGKLMHDFRRTAARNLIRAGVPERVAMLLCGHRTRAIFDRYNVTNERDLREGVERLASSFTVHAQSKPRT